MSAAVMSAEPSTSMSRPIPRPVFSVIHLRPSRTVTTPMGTLTKKIQCQLSVSVITPPAISPSDAPPETTSV
jgi:hypothetical protein